MVTEFTALFDAKFYTELAMTKLKQYPGGSYCADEAYEALLEAESVLLDGLRCLETKDEVDDVNVPVSP